MSSYHGVMRAVIYTRLSRDTEASTSIERQKQACQRVCEERGWEVVYTAEDVDVSATKRGIDRPGLDAVRALYGEIDAVVYFKVDRLARSLSDFTRLMDEAEKAGVALVSATEPLDLSTPMGRAMAQIVGIFAELEARTTGARVASTWAHLKQTGRATGGIRLYGYRTAENPQGAGFVLEPDPEEALVVSEVVGRVLDRESLVSIARDLTRRGIPTRRGSQWRPDTLNRLLRNPGLQGYAIHRGSVVKGEDGLPVAFWEPLVAPAVWRSVQTELDRRSTPSERRWRSDWLLAGLIYCGHCGARMYGRSEKDGREYYVCSTPGNAGECPGVAVSRARIEEYVDVSFMETFGRFEVTEVVETPAVDNADEIEAVSTALADLEADRYERGLFPGADGAERFAELHARLYSRLDHLKVTATTYETTRTSTGITFGEEWDTSDTARRRLLLAQAVEAITVTKGKPGRHGLDPGRVRIHWSE